MKTPLPELFYKTGTNTKGVLLPYTIEINLSEWPNRGHSSIYLSFLESWLRLNCTESWQLEVYEDANDYHLRADRCILTVKISFYSSSDAVLFKLSPEYDSRTNHRKLAFWLTNFLRTS